MATKKAGEETQVEVPWTSLHPTRPEKASGDLPAKRRFMWTALCLGMVTLVLAAISWVLFWIALQSVPFQVDPKDGGLRVEGISAADSDAIRRIFSADFGKGLVSVDISGRLLELRAIPWVKTATVAKAWPRTIAVTIVEREPVAFLRLPVSNAVRMIDSDGMIFDLRPGGENSLPVLTGIDEEMPMEERQIRVRLFQAVMGVFGAKSRDLAEGISEIDVSDSANAVVLAKHRSGMIKLQLGNQHLQHRLDVFLNYIDAWRSEFGPVEAVDLRFEKQVAVQPIKARRGKG